MRRILFAIASLLAAPAYSLDKPLDTMPRGYFDSYAAKWQSRSLSVCWENDSSSQDKENFTNDQRIVREVVTQQYQRAGFSFTGWDACSARGSADVRVWVDPRVWPRVVAFGRQLQNTARGLQLTFDFLAAGNGWGAICQRPENRANCIRNYALHEFGHSLGLKHEADRPDAACEQKTYSAGFNVGSYDKLSIMNYCNNEAEIRRNRFPILSHNDLASLQQIYHEGPGNSQFTALAYSPSSGLVGSSRQWLSRSAAENSALGDCEQQLSQENDCRLVASAENECLALALGLGQGMGWGRAGTEDAAKATALAYCQGSTSGCRLVSAVCP